MKKNSDTFIPNTFIHLLEDRMGAVTCQPTPFQLSSYRAQDSWQPSINAFRCREGFVVSVDLAGVECSDIELQLEPERLLIRGRRQLPEPQKKAGPLLDVLAMQIDHGEFSREIDLPLEIALNKVQAEYHNGLLSITLPFRTKQAAPVR
jgi:HSP20 family molecular chaperone IbpA